MRTTLIMGSILWRLTTALSQTTQICFTRCAAWRAVPTQITPLTLASSFSLIHRMSKTRRIRVQESEATANIMTHLEHPTGSELTAITIINLPILIPRTLELDQQP